MVELVILAVVVAAIVVAAVWYLLVRRSAAQARRELPAAAEKVAIPEAEPVAATEPEQPSPVVAVPVAAAPDAAPAAVAEVVAVADPEPSDAGEPGPMLSPEAIRLRGSARDKEAAIVEVGELLVSTGAVAPEYVPSMLARERSVSTFMGNLLAIPHGTLESQGLIRRSAIALVRYPEGIDWNGNRTEFVIGIAGRDDDHVHLLSDIAGVFLDRAAIARLQAAETVAEVVAEFTGAEAAG